MNQGFAQLCSWVLTLGVFSKATAATDPFLQLSVPILTNGQVQFTFTGESGVGYVIETSEDLQTWIPLSTNMSPNAGVTNGAPLGNRRTILAEATNTLAFYRGWRTNLPIFAGAITAKLDVNLNGNNIRIDSYDSTDPAHDNPLDPNEIKAGGDVASGSGYLSIANANIHGKLLTGPNGSYAFGPSGFAGPIGWTGPGLYSSAWYRDDFRFAIPDTTAPFNSGFTPAGAGTNYWILSPGNYYVNNDVNLSAKTVLVVGGVASLYVTGSFSMSSTSEIKIEPGARLRVFVGRGSGPSVSASLTKVSTADNSAANFQYYGLPSNTSVTWSGNGNFRGTICAPQATVSMGGGGTNVYDFWGACVVNAITMNGHFGFHFDENLKVNGPLR